ncbi:ubiquitin-like protein ISG15 [Sphaeramia orbicularis]|uniref:ubiquitin-like protein ISG15 n=1 Tax=Sphaeramia orbicularis TaxID=375764 RepID=UPI00117E0014|nr:polyubiquitin-like [Sphaeramia orbicularis]
MEITIKTLTGTPHTLTVSPGDTVSSLKSLIQTRLNIPILSQRLAYVSGQNIPLNDDRRPLSSYGLHTGSVVSLLVTDPAPFQVFVKNEKGRTNTYDIKPDVTVQEFKKKVYAREQVPVDQQRLIHEGKEMMQGTLADYGVRPLSTIYMTLRLRGG